MERVDWLRELERLLCEQQTAMHARDVEATLVVVQRLEGHFRQAPQSFDSLSPLERALSRNIARLNASNAGYLESLSAPLIELDALARQHGMAVAVDCCA